MKFVSGLMPLAIIARGRLEACYIDCGVLLWPGGGNEGGGEGGGGPAQETEMVIVDGQHRLGACAHLAGGGSSSPLPKGLETVTVEVGRVIPKIALYLAKRSIHWYKFSAAGLEAVTVFTDLYLCLGPVPQDIGACTWCVKESRSLAYILFRV